MGVSYIGFITFHLPPKTESNSEGPYTMAKFQNGSSVTEMPETQSFGFEGLEPATAILCGIWKHLRRSGAAITQP